MPIDPNIALSFRGMQVADPLAQYGQVQNILAAQSQRQAAGTQNELAQTQLGQAQMTMRRAQEAQDFIDKTMEAAAKNNAPTKDPMEAAMIMSNHPNEMVRTVGRHMLEANKIVQEYQSNKAFSERGQQPSSVAAAPSTVAGSSAPVTAESITAMPAADGSVIKSLGSTPVFDRSNKNLNAWIADKTTKLDFTDWINQKNAATSAPALKINNLPAAVAAPVASVNNLATPVSKVDQIDAEIADLMSPKYRYSQQAKARIEFLNKRRDQLTKAHVVGSNLVTEEGKEIYTGKEKPLTQTELVRNFEYAKTPAGGNYRGSFAEFKAISTPKTSITYGPQEKAEKIEYGKFLVDQFKVVNDSARIAAKSLPAIEINLATLDKGFDTGFGTEAVAAGAKVLGALGVQKAEDFATNAQTFLASANTAVLQKQLEQKGPQTEYDAQRITSIGAQLGNTKEANRFVLNVAKAQLQRDIEQRTFYAKWREKDKTLEGAEDAWYAGEGGKSLFDSPVLKKYAAPTNTTVAPVKDNRPSLTKIFKNN